MTGVDYRFVAEAIPALVWISDCDDQAEYFNARWFEYTGLHPDDCVGDGWVSALHPDDVPEVVRARAATLRTGEMFETEYRVRAADGTYRWFLVRALPMRDAEGSIAAWMGTCTDIEQQKRAELRLRFLLEAGRRLSTSLEPVGLARDLAELIVPQYADYCQVFGLEHGTFTPLAIVHRTEAGLGLLHEIDGHFPLSAQAPAIARLFANAEPVAVPEVTEAMRDLGARGTEHAALLRAVNAESSIVVRYGPEDIVVAREIGRRLSMALGNARRFQHERVVADTLQTAMLPQSLPVLHGAHLCRIYQPGESTLQVGGDWYDAFELPDGTIGLSIGDVTGHGLEAAVVMGEIRQAIRSAAIEAMTPVGVLDHADRALRLARPDTIATAGFGIYDPKSHVLRYAQAGHPLPLLCNADGTIVTPCAEGLPLGMRDLGAGTEVALTVAPGTLVVFYTDGITELYRDAEAGEAALRVAAMAEREERGPNPALGIYRRIRVHDQKVDDDVAILTLYVE